MKKEGQENKKIKMKDISIPTSGIRRKGLRIERNAAMEGINDEKRRIRGGVLGRS